MDIAKLVEAINANFSEPFLPKDFVRARLSKDGTLVLFIGPRDVDIAEDGTTRGAGTALGCWKIEATA